MLVAIDIGGTKVTVATAAVTAAGTLELGEVTRHSSADHPDLVELLRFRLGSISPVAIAIGVAGPVLGRVVRLTNLPWSIDADQLESVFRCTVVLMNDLEAHGWAVAHTRPQDLVTLQKGRPRSGNGALIAAGTGLGEATLFWQDRTYVPSASEGGHTSFSPTSRDEVELLSFLLGRYGHVSWERVVSGTFGFRNLLDFLRLSGRISLPHHISEESLDASDVGPLVTEAATNGAEWARVVMQWFVRLYGAEAGNLALKSMAVSGVYIAGGIAPKILTWLKDGEFVSAFANKGRFADFLRDIPIHVITDEHAALRGAAHVAHRHAVSRGK